MTTDEMIRKMQIEAEAHGLGVRCPTCNNGIGKWCRNEAGQVVTHEARVKAAKVR